MGIAAQLTRRAACLDRPARSARSTPRATSTRSSAIASAPRGYDVAGDGPRRCSGEPAFVTGRSGRGRGARRRRRSRRRCARAAIAAPPSTSMQRGACALVPALYAEGRFDGVLGLGGGGGTTMITAAMRTLPVGVPKLMVSTMASGNTAPYVDVKDITLMYSVVDIAGLNPLSRRILANAAGAICGMVDAADATTPPDAADARDRPLLAATMFGVTTPCVTAVRERLEARRLRRAGLPRDRHRRPRDGRADRRRLLRRRRRRDDHRVVRRGGRRRAHRRARSPVGAAARKGIPQVVSVGALDMVNFGAHRHRAGAVPRSARLYRHNATVTLMRTTPDECATIGRRIAEQLNRATGPVVARAAAARRQRHRRRRASPFTIPRRTARSSTTLRTHAPRRTCASSRSTRTSTTRRSRTRCALRCSSCWLRVGAARAGVCVVLSSQFSVSADD